MTHAGNTALPDVGRFSEDSCRSHTLPGSYYYAPGVFELEKRAIFNRTWQYVCHLSRVAEPGREVEGADLLGHAHSRPTRHARVSVRHEARAGLVLGHDEVDRGLPLETREEGVDQAPGDSECVAHIRRPQACDHHIREGRISHSATVSGGAEVIPLEQVGHVIRDRERGGQAGALDAEHVDDAG